MCLRFVVYLCAKWRWLLLVSVVDSAVLYSPLQAPLAAPAAATHHFRNLMNCTNLRLTSSPVFLFLQSQTVTGGESFTHTLGTWELMRTHHLCLHNLTHTCTHAHAHTQGKWSSFIDRVIERFKIHLPSTVRQALLSLEFNRLRQTALGMEENIF